jgi:ATP-dependent RNA helicase RhlE
MSFSVFGLHADILRGVADLGFSRATPIQSDAIPPALEGRDLLACAQTGSGKTAAFLLPIMQRLLGKPRGVTRALVLTPTRELAAQVAADLQDLAKHTKITAAAVFGGVGMAPQEQAFRKGVDIIVATPGRLLDHFQQPYARLSGLEILVLDEADRMLDMGFLPDIKRVLRHIPSQRQTLFFSATMPAPIAQLSHEILRSPIKLNVERQGAPAAGVTQAVYPVSQELKSALLVEMLKRGDIKSVLVFTRTKHRTNRLTEYLVKQGIAAERIHGRRSQGQRTQALDGFKNGEYQVLVATDIAARGIDVTELGHVINFDVPVQSEDYVHRIGRTARAEATGYAFTFVSPEEEGELRAIERAIKARLPRMTVAGFDYANRPKEQLEIPLAQRIAEIRARKAAERARAKEKAERAAQRPQHPPKQSEQSNARRRRRGGRGRGKPATP